MKTLLTGIAIGLIGACVLRWLPDAWSRHDPALHSFQGCARTATNTDEAARCAWSLLSKRP